MFWNSWKKNKPASANLDWAWEKPAAKSFFSVSKPKKVDGVVGFYAHSYANLRTAISSGTKIQGRLSFDKPVKIDGALNGEVSSSEEVVIGPEAIFHGNLQAGNVIVFGKIQGQIAASGKVVLFDGAKVDGDVACQSLSFSDGAHFNGRCSMNIAAAAVERATA